MESAFSLAHAFTAQWEGGYVNHPNDPGGATKYGISLRWLRDQGMDINDDGVVDEKDIRALTRDTAANLYHSYFWTRPGICRLPALVAVVVYDGAVNTGIGRAVRQMQDVSNTLGGGYLTTDGVIGPLTLARVDALCNNPWSELSFSQTLVAKRMDYHERLGESRRFAPFLEGWLNRCHALSGYILTLAERGRI